MSYNDLRKGRYSEPGRECLVTAVTHLRRSIFKDFHVVRLLITEMRRLEQDDQVTWLAWVVMPDHLHGLLSLQDGANLSTVMNDLKGRSARAINQALGLQGPFWQSGFHDHTLRREEDRLATALHCCHPLARRAGNQIGRLSALG